MEREIKQKVEKWFGEFCDRNISLGKDEVRTRIERHPSGSELDSLPLPWRDEDVFVANLELKRRHTFRVASYAADIASSLCDTVRTGGRFTRTPNSGVDTWGLNSGVDSGVDTGADPVVDTGGLNSGVDSGVDTWGLNSGVDTGVDTVVNMGGVESDIVLASIIALLHDVGRFPQLRRHGTFSDLVGECHAALGVETLLEEGIDKLFLPSDYEIIKTSIAYHNAYKLPQITDKRTLAHAKIIRDADKLDILGFLVGSGGKSAYYIEQNTVPGNFDEDLVRRVLAHENLSYKLLKTKADRVLFDVSLIFDINFPRSFDIIKSNSYPERIMSPFIGQHPAIFDIIKSTNLYIDERASRII